MLSKEALRVLHKAGVRYSFKLPWNYVEETIPEVIDSARWVMEQLYNDDRVRMPFGPGHRYCFYTDRNDLESILAGSYVPTAVIAYQQQNDSEVFLAVIGRDGKYVTHKGKIVECAIYDNDGDADLGVVPQEGYSEDEQLPREIEELFKNAATIFAVSMFLLNFPDVRMGGGKPRFKRAARQRQGVPANHIIQVARHRYITEYIAEKRKRKIDPKRPHDRRGTWCESSKTGKRWWRRPCAIHGGGGDQDYRL